MSLQTFLYIFTHLSEQYLGFHVVILIIIPKLKSDLSLFHEIHETDIQTEKTGSCKTLKRSIPTEIGVFCVPLLMLPLQEQICCLRETRERTIAISVLMCVRERERASERGRWKGGGVWGGPDSRSLCTSHTQALRIIEGEVGCRFPDQSDALNNNRAVLFSFGFPNFPPPTLCLIATVHLTPIRCIGEEGVSEAQLFSQKDARCGKTNSDESKAPVNHMDVQRIMGRLPLRTRYNPNKCATQ